MHLIPQISRFHVVVMQGTSKIFAKIRAAAQVQHDYLWSFNQWYHCFVALMLSPPSFLKLPNADDMMEHLKIDFHFRFVSPSRSHQFNARIVNSLQGKRLWIIGSLSNHDDDGNKNPTNLHIWQWKTVPLHALHVHFSSFDIWRRSH